MDDFSYILEEGRGIVTPRSDAADELSVHAFV